MKPVIPDAALAQHTAILGKTGSGKTSTAKLAIEQVVAEGARVCVLDPIKSDWWGLTSSADGKRPGLPFHILGGPRGHVPLHSSAGKAIGELVGTGTLPLSILDMADFEAGGLQRFFIDFAGALLKKMRGVVYLVIEEAHEFAPKERSGIGQENMAIHWAKKLATAGRSRGIRLVLATQRTQSLHNAMLGSCETMIVHRITAPADQEPVKKWLGANTTKDVRAKVEQSLAGLKTGTGWICSGEAGIFEQVHFPRIKTYDNTATPTHDSTGHDVKTAPVDIDKLRTIIGDVVQEADANDPAKLKAEVARLQGELARKPAVSADDADQRYSDGYQTGHEHGQARGDGLGYARGQAEAAPLWFRRGAESAIRAVHDDMAAFDKAAFIETALAEFKDIGALPAPPSSGPPAVNHSTAAPPTRAPAPMARVAMPSPAAGGDGSLPLGERECLIVIAQSRDGVRRPQITVITGYKKSSRDAYIQRLRSKSYVEVVSDRVVATAAGVAALGGFYEPPLTGRALQDRVMARLPEGERKVLQVLIDQYPREVSRSVIDDVTGYKKSSRDAYLQRLAARELLDERTGAGTAKASEVLFK